MKPIIQIEGVSKRYQIGKAKVMYPTLRDALASAVRAPVNAFKRNGNSAPATIWALRDINAEIEPGETVGIIGVNGAGKSTLLKILSRITEPTAGRVRLWGRISSMLEVGTGFHLELTGRENIFLNGAILGMTRREITDRFDEIVAFSGVEKFIDTPVKHYSSGMYLRLAFAVAAHLEPEILIVDEVLAVGDAAFQKKCLGKMGDVAGEGRTVVFVSHNMQAIRQLCRRALWLQDGILVADGAAAEVADMYLRDAPRVESAQTIHEVIRKLPADPDFRWRSIGLTQNNVSVERVLNGSSLEINIEYEVLKRTTGMRVFFDLFDSDGNLLFRSFNDEDRDGIPTVEPGTYVSTATIPENFLAPRIYELRVYATVYNVRMCVPEQGIIIPLPVEASGRANRAYVGDPIRGRLAPVIPWVTSAPNESDSAELGA